MLIITDAIPNFIRVPSRKSGLETRASGGFRPAVGVQTNLGFAGRENCSSEPASALRGVPLGRRRLSLRSGLFQETSILFEIQLPRFELPKKVAKCHEDLASI